MPKLKFTIKAPKLARGLRPSKRMPRDSRLLVTCAGAVGRDGVLQALDQFSRLATGDDDTFPYPQIFVFTEMILICTATKIYEWVSSALVLKATVSAGSTWVALDFHDFVYLSNGNVVVKRNPLTNAYSETTDYPTAMAAVNFNGQVLLGAPDNGYET